MKRVIDALTRNRDPFGGQTIPQFPQGDIRLGRQNLMQPILVPREPPPLLTPHLARGIAACLSPPPDKNNRARSAHAKAPRRRASRTPRPHRLDNPFAKIKRMTIPHIVPPIPPTTTSRGNRESPIPIRVNPDLL
jgi:hypothetical protein